jgi:NTP pyrophosphatase (non-canonical NTP hydrolase)
MLFDDYQKQAMTFAMPRTRNITYMILGLTNEAGEAAGKIKKVMRGDKELDKQALGAELGDCLWYLSGLASQLGLSLGEIANDNLQKLESRQLRGKLTGDGDNR